MSLPRGSIFVLIAGLAACSRESPTRTAEEAGAAYVGTEELVDLRGRVVDGANAPMTNDQFLVEPREICRIQSMSRPYLSSTIVTDAEGRFHLRIPRLATEGCRRLLSLGPPRDVLDGPLDPRSPLNIELPARIESSGLDLGDLQMIPAGAGRPYKALSDDELEAAIPRAEISSLSDSRHELEALLTEMVRRGSARFEAFLETQLTALRQDSAEGDAKQREFFVLTALRRIQHRPDPLQVRVLDDTLRSEFPEIPVVHVQMANVDEPGSTLLAIENCRSWCYHWFAEVRTAAGERVSIRISPFLGSSGHDARRPLAPGEFASDRVVLSEKAAFREAGIYEVRLHYQESSQISQELHLENRIVSSSPWTRLEILPRTVRATRAELNRAQSAIEAVDDSTPVRLKWNTFDPAHPFIGEARTSEEVLWSLGWKSLQPLLSSLDQKALTPHKRAWILAQLHNLTDLHDPGVQRKVMGEFQRVNAWFVESEGAWHVDEDGSDWSFGLDEARQVEFAKRWGRTAQSFQFETVD